jgi:hypothetical protein
MVPHFAARFTPGSSHGDREAAAAAMLVHWSAIAGNSHLNGP